MNIRIPLELAMAAMWCKHNNDTRSVSARECITTMYLEKAQEVCLLGNV